MNNRSMTLLILVVSIMLTACGQKEPASEPEPDVVEIRAVGKTFEGPSQIPSGWTTFRFVNASAMTHFGIIDVPPDGITIVEFDELATVFQDLMDAMNAGDEEAVNEAYSRFPQWAGELGRHGGPGILSAGRTEETTVYLEPGYYLIECYVKSDGIFHTTSPADGQFGMVMELTVTDEISEAPEPEANATLSISNDGFELTDGKIVEGRNTIRVNFLEQQALPTFVGNDVHLIQVEDEESINLANAWLDWSAPEGLEDPGPVTFLGGINDLPAGDHGYLTVDLSPGDYAFIAEMPNPVDAGFVLPFSVGQTD